MLGSRTVGALSRDMQRIVKTILVAAVGMTASGLGAQTLRGSHSSVDLMYTSARSHDLAFLQSRADIYEAARLGELKLLNMTMNMTLDHVAFPFVLPNTYRFIDSLAAAYHAGCGERLVVTSGARPSGEQPRNASPLSVHPTGMAVDFRKSRTPACLNWMRTSLLVLEQRHVVEATEERHPPHFHVAVLAQQPERYAAQLARGVAPSAPGAIGAPRVQTASGFLADQSSSSSTYRVRAGDNLWTIAQHHNTTPKAIQALNGLKTTRLRVGQHLKLP